MPRHEHSRVAERPEPPGDRVDQVLMVAHREVGAADRALEQHVADTGELRFGMVEHDMARRVAGAVIDVEGQLPHGHLVAVRQPARRLEHRAADAIGAPVLVEPGDPEPVRLVRPLQRHAQLLGELARRAAMIDMAVRHQDLLDGHALLPRGGAQLLQVAAGIDKGAAHRLGAPQKRAVLLERRDRDHRGAHRGIRHGAEIGAAVRRGNTGLPWRPRGCMRGPA